MSEKISLDSSELKMEIYSSLININIKNRNLIFLL